MNDLLITCATEFELTPLRQKLKKNNWKQSGKEYIKGDRRVTVEITGVGIALTAFNMGIITGKYSPRSCIQAGIAGSIDKEIALGEVVQIKEDQFGFWGARDKDDIPLSCFEVGLLEKDVQPFTDGKLINPNPPLSNFKHVKAITVNETTGSDRSIAELHEYYDADIETMESASFMYACLKANWHFHCLRSISNYVEPRNKSNWNLELAINRLADVLIEIIEDTE